jgi:hypothetical protein
MVGPIAGDGNELFHDCSRDLYDRYVGSERFKSVYTPA